MNNYYVIEIQTHANGTAGNIITGFVDRLVAEDAFCQARSAANDSTVMIHTVMWIDNRGNTIEKVSYTHPGESIEQQDDNNA